MSPDGSKIVIEYDDNSALTLTSPDQVVWTGSNTTHCMLALTNMVAALASKVAQLEVKHG